MSNFRISIDGGDYLPVDAIWPDGNAPENPTDADVVAVIKRSGSLSQWLSEWNMEETISVFVNSERVTW